MNSLANWGPWGINSPFQPGLDKIQGPSGPRHLDEVGDGVKVREKDGQLPDGRPTFTGEQGVSQIR
jgi:hypothetical protein